MHNERAAYKLTVRNALSEAWRSKRRILCILVYLAIAVFSVLYCFSVSSFWKLSEDSVTYVLAGQSLASGKGYLEAGHTVYLYPPGTSAILAFGWLIGRGSYLVLNAEVVAFALGSMVFCFLLFRQTLGELGAGIVVLMCLASAALFTWSTFLLSDIFYLFFSLLALWLYSRGSAKGTALSLFAACATRLIGVSLAAAMLIDLMRSPKKRWAFVMEVAGVIGFVAMWELRNYRKGWSHTGLMLEKDPWVRGHGLISPAGLFHRFLLNFANLRVLENVLTNGLTTNIAANVIIGILLLLVCVAGFRELSKSNAVAAIYCILLSLIVCVYHPWIETRWLLPLLPLLFACFYSGILLVAARTGKSAYGAFALFAVLYLITGLRFQLHSIPLEHKTPFPGERVRLDENYDLEDIAVWWKHRTLEDDKFASDHPTMIQVMTGHSGVSYPESDDPVVLEKKLMRDHALYVFVDSTSERDNQWVLSAIKKSSHFQLLRAEPRAQLYEFVPAQ